jgi:two-component system sensor histidine kinase CpxA
MRLRFSLFSKIMLWFFLNLLLLGLILALIFKSSSSFDSGTGPLARSTNRIEAVTRLIESQMNDKSRAERDEVLKKYAETYGVKFYMFDSKGQQLAGPATTLPTEIFSEITHPETLFPTPAQMSSQPREQPPRMIGPPPSLYLKTSTPTLYWFVGRTLTFERGQPELIRTRLLVASDSYTGHGLFFDPMPYLLMAAAIIGFSILFWLPFVRSITRSIRQMTAATEQIAEEQFDVRVSDARTDELGRLGVAINQLASRLNGFVHGQKRFMGDISHELNSPLARMQFALSILEDRVGETERVYVEDVKEEVELMSKLVAELLTYSKAGIRKTNIELEPVTLRPLVERVIERETAKEQAELKLDVAEQLEVLAQPELLSRALANVVRNAVRYAGGTGLITIAAESSNGHVSLSVADKGAGVPETELEKLFDPFYRIESDRSRATGGTGLGLAIVKSCIEACQGTVSARNLSPKGFEIKFLLKRS